MTSNKVLQAGNKAHVIDEETQTLLNSVRLKNARALKWGAACFLILFAIGVGGIVWQNRIANQSKQHIDCIIKDLSTPQKPGTTHKYIDPRSSLTRDCNIKFTP